MEAGMPAWPVPLSSITWLADGVMLSALSVRVAVLCSSPMPAGLKLMLMLQDSPGLSEKVALQSAGVPLPATCVKLAPTVRPGATAERVALPMF